MATGVPRFDLRPPAVRMRQQLHARWSQRAPQRAELPMEDRRTAEADSRDQEGDGSIRDR